MANADLKVLKVFTQNNKQIGYKVMRADGSIIDVSREQMIQAISLGHSYSNATVSDAGVVRVDSSVPREDINANKESTKVLDYHGDITEFLKEGKPITKFKSFNPYEGFKEGNFRTFYVPAGVADKAINRHLKVLYIEPDKAYEKYTFKVSVEEAKKYEGVCSVPKIHNFILQHMKRRDNTGTFFALSEGIFTATDENFTSFDPNRIEEFKDYNTITVWIYIAKPHKEGFAYSQIQLAMVKDILDVAESRYNDLKNNDIGLKKLGSTLRNVAFDTCSAGNIGYSAYKSNGIMFFDERIYKKWFACNTKYFKLLDLCSK